MPPAPASAINSETCMTACCSQIPCAWRGKKRDFGGDRERRVTVANFGRIIVLWTVGV
ncbi:hypothetical protein KCP70_17555 [Salmonella enterica subsp. enterica]|nr:hypothetical protein KCP70_17555 [Salmonella enterica subsp. enterica]